MSEGGGGWIGWGVAFMDSRWGRSFVKFRVRRGFFFAFAWWW